MYDVVIVGAGAAGAAAAWRLCQRGLKVALLERGVWQDPQNYPSTASDWELRKAAEYSPLPAKRDSAFDYPVDNNASQIDVCNFNGVGGSTILYSGHFPRFQPEDFQLFSRRGIYEDWPIDYEDLQPYFEMNEKMMTVAGLVGDPMYPDIKTLLPPVPLGQAGNMVAKAFNELKWHWWPSYSAIATRPINARAACLNLGPCNTGCPQGAKSSTDVTYVTSAVSMQLELITEAAVSSVITEDDRAVGVRWFDREGIARETRGAKILLASSAIGTPRILLNSSSTRFPHGVANSSGLVGKNLMIHPLGYVEGLFPAELDVDVGPQGCMLYSLEHYRGSDRDFDLGYMMHVLRGTGPLEAARSAYTRKKLRFGSHLESDFMKFFRKQLAISIICEDLPDSGNKVTLSGETDRFGVPGIKVCYSMSENSRKMMSHGLQSARQVLKLAGAHKTYVAGPVREAGWHVMGTCKMGNDPKTSVVNQIGEAHDVANLFVIDSSCFVTGSCVNPANTIQAVALYLADKIADNFKKPTLS